MSLYTFLVLSIFPGALIYAAIRDTMSLTLSNKISLLLLAGFFALAPFSGMDWTTFGFHLLAGLMIFFIGFGIWSLGLMGGGDAKLYAVIALWIGFNKTLLVYTFYVTLVGGLVALAVLALQKTHFIPSRILEQHSWLARLSDPKETKSVPYGIALAVAGIIMFPETVWIQSIVF